MLLEQISRIHLLIERDKLDIAQQKISETLAEYPDADDIHVLQAELYLRQDENKKAIKAANTAIGLNPENDDAFFIQSRVYLEQESYKKAHQAIDRALALNAHVATYYAVKALIYLNSKDPNQALSLAEKGLELDPDDLLCNNVLSMAQSRVGQSAVAHERLKYMLAKDPENSLTQANMGYHYLSRGEIKKAKTHFSEALRQDPTNEYTQAGMLQAIKSSNWFYRKFLQYSLWIEKIGTKNKFALYIGVIVLVKLIPLLLPFYLLIILWSWFAAPLSDVILYFDRYGRYLMTKENFFLTQINVALLAAALLSLTLSFAVDSSFFGLAFGLVLTIVPVYLVDASVKKLKKGIMWGFAAMFTGLGVWGVYTSLALNESGFLAWGGMVLGAIAFSWIASLID